MVTADPAQLPLRGNDLSVDFVNTVNDVRTARGEYLPSPNALTAWAGHAAAVSDAELKAVAASAEADPVRALAQYRQALRLRTSITRLLTGNGDDADLEVVDRLHRRSVSWHALRSSRGRLSLEWVGPRDLDLVTFRVVDAFVALATSETFGRVRQCAGQPCGWLYVDLSPGQRRRWCSMQDCGNRAKVRQFRSRQQERPRRSGR